MSPESIRNALIIYATGQVGQAMLQMALQHPEISRVIAFSRRPLLPHGKQENPVVNFDSLQEDAPWWKATFAICTLGTTLRQTKSRAAFYRVDNDCLDNGKTDPSGRDPDVWTGVFTRRQSLVSSALS